jgi:3-hydroxyacyl-[acyl-carrier-protein] dehydratase
MSEPLDVEAIRALLPHRYPMLLVDRILELTPGKRVVGLKNVTINEPYFNGHFPGQAVMPGVMIVESMAQIAGVILLSMPQYHGRTPFLGAIERARFRKPVIPGDVLVTEATLDGIRGNIGKVRAVATVNGEIVANAEIMFALKELPPLDAVDRLGQRQGEDDRDG